MIDCLLTFDRRWDGILCPFIQHEEVRESIYLLVGGWCCRTNGRIIGLVGEEGVCEVVKIFLVQHQITSRPREVAVPAVVPCT